MGKGLYQSDYEHDACGVGMVVNIHGNKSHQLVDNALKVLENMRHRGAEEPTTRRAMVQESYYRFRTSSFYYKEYPFPRKGNMVRDWSFYPKTPSDSRPSSPL